MKIFFMTSVGSVNPKETENDGKVGIVLSGWQGRFDNEVLKMF